MALVYKDRVRFLSSTTGTGTITVGAAVAKYQTPATAGVANADTFYYCIEDGNAWEIGLGTYTTSGTTLARTLVSSSTGSLLSLTGAEQVFLVAPALVITAMLRGDVESQTAITGGAAVTPKALGTITTGTVTPDPAARALQSYTNNGAHTLAPSGNNGSMLVDITNGASAGAITTSGFTKVAGDAFTTTNAQKFRCHISISTAGSLLSVQALQ